MILSRIKGGEVITLVKEIRETLGYIKLNRFHSCKNFQSPSYVRVDCNYAKGGYRLEHSPRYI